MTRSSSQPQPPAGGQSGSSRSPTRQRRPQAASRLGPKGQPAPQLYGHTATKWVQRYWSPSQSPAGSSPAEQLGAQPPQPQGLTPMPTPAVASAPPETVGGGPSSPATEPQANQSGTATPSGSAQPNDLRDITPGPNIRPDAPVEGSPAVYSLLSESAQVPLLPSAAANLERLKIILGNTADLSTRTLRSPMLGDRLVGLAWLDGMVDTQLQTEAVVMPLLGRAGLSPTDAANASRPQADRQSPAQTQGFPRADAPDELLSFLRQHLILSADVSLAEKWQDVLTAILTGKTVLLVDGSAQGLLVATRQIPHRDPQEPDVESVVRGARDGFTEDLRVNTALIRQHLQSPALRFEEIRLGRQSQIPVNLAYIAGIAHPQLVQEVRARLLRVAPRYSFNMGAGPVEQLIEDHPLSIFPTMHHSERPDRICAQLAEGRVAIIIQGTPVVLTAPTLFWEFIQSPEDYYERPFLASFVRLLRLFMLIASLTLPSIYVALVSFHQELIPPPLALRIAGGRESVPFPALFEALLMEFSFEALREAGLRLPRPLGQAMSIVGVLVIGQASVAAGVVSPFMVVVVALTAIASFVSPSYSVSISLRLLRFPLIILAGIAGLYAISWSLLGLLIHLACLRSFGVPYLSPIVPFIGEDWKDALIRAPLWTMRRRPWLYTRGSQRGVARLSPSPPIA